MCRCLFLFCFMVSTNIFAVDTIFIKDSRDFQEEFQKAIIKSNPGDIIVLPEGRFKLNNEISIFQKHLKVKGQGMYKTVLDFEGQTGGSQGIFAIGDGITLEDFAVLNTEGDGIKITGTDGATFRRIRMEWERGPDSNNGGYSLYPVNTTNTLIEDCIVSGASDSGIYVGQSKNVIVRGNTAYNNVAGIEIENTQDADVYNNSAYDNSSGILVFDLPNLNLRKGGRIKIHNNKIYNNNLKNFAPKGNIVALIPKGVGTLILSTDDVEIHDNFYSKNRLTDIAITNYLVTNIEILDKTFDPTPERIYVHNNVNSNRNFGHINLSNQLAIISQFLFKLKTSKILFDGLSGGIKLKDRDICLKNNKTQKGKKTSFGNMNLEIKQRFSPLPGKASTSQKEFNCTGETQKRVVLKKPDFEPSEKPVGNIALCSVIDKSNVNFKAALLADCKKLSNYNLFQDSENPLENPVMGMPYELTNSLFTDYAKKKRFIFIPNGSHAQYINDGFIQYPVGTIITKSFYYINDSGDKKIIETRLLIKRTKGWKALPYKWNNDQTEAYLALGGGSLKVSKNWIQNKIANDSFDYHIPHANSCLACHSSKNGIAPIGPKPRYLNRKNVINGIESNQLAYMREMNLIKGMPDLESIRKVPSWKKVDISLEKRAKGYLEMNCAHCHNPKGNAGMSGLWLEYDRDVNDVHFGRCKHPVAAGTAAATMKFDVVPGMKEKSILHHRMNSNKPAVRMPELGRSIVHREGVELIGEWIDSLDGSCK